MSDFATIKYDPSTIQDEIKRVEKFYSGKNYQVYLDYEQIPLMIEIKTLKKKFQEGTLEAWCKSQKAATNRAMKQLVKQVKQDEARKNVQEAKGASKRRSKRHPHNPAGHRGTNRTPKKKRRK